MRLRRQADLIPTPVSHDRDLTKQVYFSPAAPFPLAQLASATLAPGQQTTPHAHADMHEFFLVQAGVASIRIDNRMETLQPGDCIWIEPGETHQIENQGNQELCLLYFGLIDQAP